MEQCKPTTDCTKSCCIFPIETFPKQYRAEINKVIGGDNRVVTYEEMQRAEGVEYDMFRKEVFDKYGKQTNPAKTQISDSSVTIKESDGYVYKYKIEKSNNSPNIITKTNLTTGSTTSPFSLTSIPHFCCVDIRYTTQYVN